MKCSITNLSQLVFMAGIFGIIACMIHPAEWVKWGSVEVSLKIIFVRKIHWFSEYFELSHSYRRTIIETHHFDGN